HIFYVFKNANVEMILQQYILRRWMKNLIPAALKNKRNKYGEKNVVFENYANEAISIVDHCVYLLSKDGPRSTKGRKKLRIKGGKEKSIEKSLKGRNSCSLYGGTDHNKRTCPRRFEDQDEVVVQKEVCQDEVF
nr:protein FAR1-related sequence 5 [Tanacetum cinerariifolium]